MNDRYTKYCVHCGKPAKGWTCHVLDKEGNKITAGWCAEHREIPAGFVGHYKKWMSAFRNAE